MQWVLKGHIVTLTFRCNKREFRKNKGTQFDPKLADLFLDILENHYDEIKEIQEKYTGIEDEDYLSE